MEGGKGERCDDGRYNDGRGEDGRGERRLIREEIDGGMRGRLEKGGYGYGTMEANEEKDIYRERVLPQMKSYNQIAVKCESTNLVPDLKVMAKMESMISCKNREDRPVTL